MGFDSGFKGLKYAKEDREKEVLINDVLSWRDYTALMTGE